MEQLGHPGFFKTYEKTEQWVHTRLDRTVWEYSKYTIDPDTLEVDIDGTLAFNPHPFDDLLYLPVQFRKVSGSCILGNLYYLRSLKGSPYYVGEDFIIDGCHELITLRYSPMEIGNLFYFGNGGLITNRHESKVKTGEYNKNIIHLEYNPIYHADKYVKHLLTMCKEERRDDVEWFKRVDSNTYYFLYPYIIKHPEFSKLEGIVSDSAFKIANIALEINHKL